MKKSKIKISLILLSLIAVSSCAAGDMFNSSNLPHLDGTTYEEISSFTYDNKNYTISIPTTDETYFMYKESEYTSMCQVWTINYSFDCYYIYDNNFNEDVKLFDFVYDELNKNIDLINALLNETVVLPKNNQKIEVEEVLSHNFNEEVSFMYYDKLLPIRLKNQTEYFSYTVSIPISRRHLINSATHIQNPSGEGIITLAEFYAIPKVIKNKFY